ncbi:substrate-binding domain-containing protein [Nitratireductor sp. GCM10026969]|uniref:substrate-binding domain-containing protein n=1 Tax=Nitratireductor sp. GCM10026969 TaxID=3252645 RepID=UPI003620277C
MTVSHLNKRVCVGLSAAFASVVLAQSAAAEMRQLRVCSDPNNLPFSNEEGGGFENRIAEMIAEDFGVELSYTWWAQRRGFVRNTLKAGNCDVIMGVPAGYELVETTEPYYRSTYVYVYRDESGLDLHSISDPRLKELKIGVHLIGDDGANTPPAHALGSQGIVDNVSGYMIYGDYREPNPPARIIDAVASGKLDVAAVWGPLGGYFATRAPVAMRAVPITDTEEVSSLRFAFSIAMGVRKDDQALKEQLDDFLQRRQDDIDAVLEEYGVPLVDG